MERWASNETLPVSFRCASAVWNTVPTSAQSETKNGATLTRISLAVPLGGDRERLGDRMPERVGHGARHRRAGRRGHAGVHHPELDPVAFAMEADQVRADRGAAVEAELADALGDLGDQQIVAVELRAARARDRCCRA